MIEVEIATPNAPTAGPGAEARILRRFLFLGLGCASVLALTYLGLALSGAGNAGRAGLAAAVCALLAAVFAWLVTARQRIGLVSAVVWAVASTMLAADTVAMVAGDGVRSLGLAFVPLLVCAAIAAVGARRLLLFPAVHALTLLVLALAESASTFGAPSAATLIALATQAALTIAGVVVGLLLRHSIEHTMARAAAREQRFAGLLAVAADWYWEMDSQFRFTHASEHVDGGSGVPASRRLGRAPWQIDGFGLGATAMDAHRADLESHRPFAELQLQRRTADGQMHWYSVSGRPRLDARGVFLGYWGVGRDITAIKQVELAGIATETRYRELFARSPSPLILHRDTLVLDANAAALALFGIADAAALIGRSLLDFYDDEDDSRRFASARAQALNDLPVGEAMPAHPFVLRAMGGRRVVATITSVKVEALGGPAILSIYQDDTERLRAEAARARSEALMAHLVATSPDLITLTELATGTYVMVNDAFTRITGWGRDEVIGKTAVDVGVWAGAEARERFVQEVRERGGLRDRTVEVLDRQGRTMLLLLSAAHFTLDGRDYLVLNGRDVTSVERERLEREAILENASIGIATTRERVFHLANPKFEQMFGYAAGALLGQPGAVVWPDQAAYQALGREIGPALARGEPVDIERVMKRRDGSTFLCRLLARAVDPSHPSKGATIWIAEDVTERHAVRQALARARDDAEAANRAKSAFLANTSHEIRTPLNGLVGLARLARQPGLDATRREHYLQQIDDSAQALSGVIGDILDLSKIEAGKLRLEAIDFDLHALLESIDHGYAALAEARTLSLETVVREGVPRRVRGDPARLRQVLSNFLSNALKFTEQGRVRIEVRPSDATRLRFEVSDNGPGIEPAIQSQLFTPFMQADASTTRRFGGTGLGLSICRQLAELMGGAVGVDSSPGQGSRFWAELPLPASEEASPDSAFAAMPQRASPLSGLRVLIAEDNPVNMLIAVALLEQWGVRAMQVGNGAQAVSVANAQADAGTPFDLVLMDVQMPVMGGYEAARELRQRHAAKALPIIALTAAALASERDEALASGMNDFLTKPIDAQRLHDTLLQWRRAK
jgi:PAS domain S-box-containing protein